MKVLLSYIGYPVSAGKYFKKALRGMGCEVIHLGPDAKGTIPWQPDTDFSAYADKPDIALDYPSPHIYPMESALEKSGEVDLVIQMDAHFHLVGKSPVPNIVWMIDNHAANYNESVKDADVIFGAHSWGYHHEDKNFVWLPCAYSPEDHFQIPDIPKQLDLMFLGVVYPHRAQFLNELSKYGKVGMGAGVLGKEYNAAYNTARMGFCLSLGGDVPMRVFENAAQGLMPFCDLQRDLDKLGLKDGVHYIGFGSLNEAVARFKILLGDPERVAEIAKNAKAALAGDTYANRFERMLEYL